MENNNEIKEMDEIITDTELDEIEDFDEPETSKGPGLIAIGIAVGAAAFAAGSAVKKRFIDPKIAEIKEKRAAKKEVKKTENEVEMIEGKDFEAVEDED